eukprot:s2404_g1.t5
MVLTGKRLNQAERRRSSKLQSPIWRRCHALAPRCSTVAPGLASARRKPKAGHGLIAATGHRSCDSPAPAPMPQAAVGFSLVFGACAYPGLGASKLLRHGKMGYAFWRCVLDLTKHCKSQRIMQVFVVVVPAWSAGAAWTAQLSDMDQAQANTRSSAVELGTRRATVQPSAPPPWMRPGARFADEEAGSLPGLLPQVLTWGRSRGGAMKRMSASPTVLRTCSRTLVKFLVMPQSRYACMSWIAIWGQRQSRQPRPCMRHVSFGCDGQRFGMDPEIGNHTEGLRRMRSPFPSHGHASYITVKLLVDETFRACIIRWLHQRVCFQMKRLCGKPWSTTGRSTTAEASSSAKQKAAGARETSTGPFEVRKAVVPRCKLDLRCFLVRAIAPRCENRPLEVVVS